MGRILGPKIEKDFIDMWQGKFDQGAVALVELRAGIGRGGSIGERQLTQRRNALERMGKVAAANAGEKQCGGEV